MPAISGITFSAEEYAALTAPTPPAPEPSHEQQLQAALDMVLLRQLEAIVDRAMLDELCNDNPLAADRLLTLAIRELEWRRDRLRPRAAA